jgi:hypothetical protein
VIHWRRICSLKAENVFPGATMKIGLMSVALFAILGLGGCYGEVEDGPPVVGVGPVVYDSWYWGGYYDGPYWVYRDHGGHWYHEARGEHDARFRSGHFGGGHEGGHAFGGHEGGGHIGGGGHGGESHGR